MNKVNVVLDVDLLPAVKTSPKKDRFLKSRVELLLPIQGVAALLGQLMVQIRLRLQAEAALPPKEVESSTLSLEWTVNTGRLRLVGSVNPGNTGLSFQLCLHRCGLPALELTSWVIDRNGKGHFSTGHTRFIANPEFGKLDVYQWDGRITTYLSVDDPLLEEVPRRFPGSLPDIVSNVVEVVQRYAKAS